ncbi:MAG TPA: hypothetical protein VGH86_12325 [Phenylobacterium sp.]|jgi:hypothetical protein
MLKFAAGLLLALSAAGARAAEPPKLGVVMTPHVSDGGAGYVGVQMTMERPNLAAGAPLVHLPLKLVGIPSIRLDGDALSARDDQGPLALTQSEEPPTPQGVYRRWSVARATVGDVVVNYKAPPRPVTAATNNGPLFDLRLQPGGFAGAGVGFVATPVAPGPWRVHLHWDLSEAPAGSRGVWSLGEGDVDTVAPSDLLAFSYYAAGAYRTYPAQTHEKFGVYWFGEPPFDVAEFAGRIQKLYAGMADFFGDADASYRVFIRQNPYSGTGGTSLAHSFMFGYESAAKPTLDSLQGLVAHEMTHNWPAMQGEHGDTAWYSEGTAEYYSLLLSYRGGALTTDRFLKSLNEKAAAYYTNPYRGLSNPAAAKIFWTDPVAQTVPYGRGILYLARTDAAIRAKSGGRRSLDDIVKEIRRRQVKDQPYGIPEWLALVGAEIGPAQAKAEYDAMVAGDLLVLPESRFAPCFSVVKGSALPFQLGFARASLNDDRIVRDLEPGSAAAKAGVRNGDVIVSASDVNKVRNDETQTMTLTLRRGATETSVTYLPRGAPVPAYHWVRNPKVPDTACRF